MVTLQRKRQSSLAYIDQHRISIRQRNSVGRWCAVRNDTTALIMKMQCWLISPCQRRQISISLAARRCEAAIHFLIDEEWCRFSRGLACDAYCGWSHLLREGMRQERTAGGKIIINLWCQLYFSFHIDTRQRERWLLFTGEAKWPLWAEEPWYTCIDVRPFRC